MRHGLLTVALALAVACSSEDPGAQAIGDFFEPITAPTVAPAPTLTVTPYWGGHGVRSYLPPNASELVIQVDAAIAGAGISDFAIMSACIQLEARGWSYYEVERAFSDDVGALQDDLLERVTVIVERHTLPDGFTVRVKEIIEGVTGKPVDQWSDTEREWYSNAIVTEKRGVFEVLCQRTTIII